MPILAVGAVGVVIAALMALLVIYAAETIARLVGHLAPNWHIPGLGNIRNAILHAASVAVHSILGWLDQAVAPVGHFLLAPFHIMSHLFAVTGDIAAAVVHAFARVMGRVWFLYHSAIHYATGVLHAAYSRAWFLYQVVHRYAAHVLSLAYSRAWFLYDAAIRYSTGILHLAKVAAAAALSAAVHKLSASVLFAEHYAETLWRDARHYAASLSAAATTYATSLYHDTLARIGRAEHDAEVFATHAAASAAHAAVGVLTTDVAGVVDRIWDGLIDDVGELVDVIATDLPDIGALARAIPRAIPLDIAGTIGISLALDRVAVRFMRECGVPNCKNLGGFGRALQDLFGLAEGAGLLALLAAMASDPEGTAAELDDLLGGTVRATGRALGDLVGV